jgi:hypothetical protein
MRSRQSQSGITILGFIFVTAVVLVVALVGFRVFPAYIEYYSVKKALEQSLGEVRDLGATGELRKNFQKKVDAGYIESVDGRDVDVKKVGNEYVATVAWSRRLHLVGNASLLLDFEAQALR